MATPNCHLFVLDTKWRVSCFFASFSLNDFDLEKKTWICFYRSRRMWNGNKFTRNFRNFFRSIRKVQLHKLPRGYCWCTSALCWVHRFRTLSPCKLIEYRHTVFSHTYIYVLYQTCLYTRIHIACVQWNDVDFSNSFVQIFV